jgi:ABC-type transporter lipoprotein component MlaA
MRFSSAFPKPAPSSRVFGINTTVGLLGLFDPADKWFGLKEHPDDFGLTLRYYGAPTGPYLMLPFFGPSAVGDTWDELPTARWIP